MTGALNTASYTVPGFPNSGLAQGSMIAIFGRNLGPAAIVQASSFPLPATLGGTSAKITVGGQTRDLILTYTLATQIGAIVPSSTPLGAGQLTVTYNGQTSAAFNVQVVASQFGIFTINQGGSGPAVVQNFNTQADQPVNTLFNSAKPGQTVTLWGTGLGPISGSDAGAPPTGDLSQPIEVLVGGRLATVRYKGRSGCCSAVDQIVFDIPSGITGCYVPLIIKNGNRVSNTSSISIAQNGGTCSDPLGYSAADLNKAQTTGNFKVGSVSLTRVNIKLSVAGFDVENTTEVAAGAFYGFDQSQLVASNGASGSALTVGACTLYTYYGDQTAATDPVLPRALDAGAALTLNGPNGTKQLQKGIGGLYNVVLGTSTNIGGGGIPGLPGGIPGLPGGGSSTPYLTPGSYNITGPGGSEVGAFSSNLTIAGNFTWTNQAQVTQINRGSDQVITWSGAPADGYVLATGQSMDTNAKVGGSFMCVERGSAGRLTVPASILLALPQSSVVEGSPTGQLSVGLISEPVRFSASGLDVGAFSYSNLYGKNLNYQ
ncbi:MAG TPA: hypothetical protein VFQ91_22400 [Bryobacteraceae bacterium]|nr:hypothetical protein [Bryobacteraceae bacterium]